MPTNQAQYIGDAEGVKFWNWSNGALITYNSQEGSNANELSGALGFYAIKELIKTGNSISHDNNAVNSSTNSPSKTFPVYADDGTLIGYFAPGSIVHPSPNDDSYIVNSDGSLSLYSRGNDYYDNSADD